MITLTIPKIIFQTYTFKPTHLYVSELKQYCLDFSYLHFTNEEIIEFILSNPIIQFPDAVSVFNKFQIGAHKADFFRYYFLFLNGGIFIDSDAMLETDMQHILMEKHHISFFTVISCTTGFFNGFIGSAPGHEIIFESLKWMYENYDMINTDYFSVCLNLKFNHGKYIESHTIKENNGICLFCEEKLPDNKCAVTKNSNDDILLTHYFMEKIIPNKLPLKHVNINPKIGISLALHNSFNDLFNSGCQQNALFFAELLLNIGYDVYIFINHFMNETDMNLLMYDKRFKFIKETHILQYELDLLFIVGYDFLNDIVVKHLRQTKTRIIYYKCSNDYFIDCEEFVYDYPRTSNHKFGYYDEIWSIPQMFKLNRYYWESIYRVECVEVPFIWSPCFIDKPGFVYTRTTAAKKKTVAIFEPNISIMKCAIPPLLICENMYRKNKLIDKVLIMNTEREFKDQIMNVNKLENFVENLDLYKDNIIFIEKHYNINHVMKTCAADIVVSHTLENPLNYLYLELAWMGYPIIHNGYLCKDVGYYYDGYNYKEGGSLLDYVIQNHDSNLEEYFEKNRTNITKYLPANENLLQCYKLLVDNLLI